MGNHNELIELERATDDREAGALKTSLELVRFRLAKLVDWRTSGTWTPTDEVMYYSLCSSECDLLNRCR